MVRAVGSLYGGGCVCGVGEAGHMCGEEEVCVMTQGGRDKARGCERRAMEEWTRGERFFDASK